MVLSLLFLAVFALYLNVKPAVESTGTTPAGGSSDVEAPVNPLVPSEPAAPETTEEPAPTTEPEETEGGVRDADDGRHVEPVELVELRSDVDHERHERPRRDRGTVGSDDRDDGAGHPHAVLRAGTVTEAVRPSHDAATRRRARSSSCPARRRPHPCPHEP